MPDLSEYALGQIAMMLREAKARASNSREEEASERAWIARLEAATAERNAPPPEPPGSKPKGK